MSMWSLRWHFTNKSVAGVPYRIKSYSYSMSHSWTLRSKVGWLKLVMSEYLLFLSFSWNLLGRDANPWGLPYVHCTKNRLTCENYIANYKIFQEHQPNSRRFPVFPGAISNSWRFPGAVGTLIILIIIQNDAYWSWAQYRKPTFAAGEDLLEQTAVPCYSSSYLLWNIHLVNTMQFG